MSDLTDIARHRIAELEADLHRWRGVLELASREQPARRPLAIVPESSPVVRTGPLTAKAIIQIVARRHGLTSVEMLAKTRAQPANQACMIAMALTRKLTDLSLTQIGKAFDRDHSTVLNACRVTEGMMLGDYLEALGEVG